MHIVINFVLCSEDTSCSLFSIFMSLKFEIPEKFFHHVLSYIVELVIFKSL